MRFVTKCSMVGAAAVLLCAAMPAWAGDVVGPVTFTKDVLPILQENCQTCHREGGKNMSGMIAPMAFTSYQETRPWAKAIAKVVETKEMPPWHATEDTHGVFSNETTLTQDEIDTILTWVRTGAKMGNPADAPEPKEWKSGWLMGEPDLLLTFPEPFYVEDDVQDLYKNINVTLTEEQLPQDAWVTGIEFVPGSEVVHHIIAYASDPDADVGELGENEDTEGNEEALRGRVMLGGLAPGTDARFMDEGFGIPIKKGATITFAMHYHKEAGPGTGRMDDSVLALRLTTEKPEREVGITTIAHGAFEIPPYHPNWEVSGAKTFDKSIMLLSLMPHTHLRGKETKYTAYYPDGTSEMLLYTPNYDFNWQREYFYKEPKVIPAGTRIEFEIVYDNSEENAAEDGFNPARAVRFGGPTTDEMDLGWYTYAMTDPKEDMEAGD
jgi:mono/diheme cytochrome c family protein